MRLVVSSSAALTVAPRRPQPEVVAGMVNIPGGGEAPPDQAGERISYVVKRGDNLFRLAQKFHTTVEHLKSWNNIPGEDILIGQTLVIYPD